MVIGDDGAVRGGHQSEVTLQKNASSVFLYRKRMRQEKKKAKYPQRNPKS